MALIQAVKQGHVRGIKLLISNGDTLSLSSNVLGTTALIEACKFENKEIAKQMIKVLLKNGANVNDRDYLGRNAMHWACMAGNNTELLNALLSCQTPHIRANLNMTDYEGNSLLHYAVKTGKCSFIRHICKLYQRYGASDWARNKDGYLAADLALSLGHKHCAVMVRNVTEFDELSDDGEGDKAGTGGNGEKVPIVKQLKTEPAVPVPEKGDKQKFLELPLIETGKLARTGMANNRHRKKKKSSTSSQPDYKPGQPSEKSLAPLSYNQRKISEEILGKITYRNLLADMSLLQSVEYSSSYRQGVDESVRLKKLERVARNAVSLPALSTTTKTKTSESRTNHNKNKSKKQTQKEVPHFRPRKAKFKAPSDGNGPPKRKPQSISSSEISQTRHLNGSATIYCSSGNSSVAKPSEVEWKHNGIVVVVSDSARISKTSENNLLIKSLDYSDAGNYSCVNGNMTLGITTLIIEGKPSLTQTFAPHTILEGSKVNITCTANSIPAASISWEKNGEPLSEAASQVSILTSVNSDVVQSRVEILSASYLQNGTFKCIASNKHGMIMHQASMQVYVGAYISKPPMSKHFARKGTNLTLTCSAFGNPIPTVLWDNKFVNMSDTSHFRIQKRISGFITTSNLEIRNIQDSVGGNYTCLAANQFVHHTHRAVSQVFIQGYEKCLKLKVKHVAQTKASVEWDLSCTKQWPSSWVYVDVIVYKDGAAASVDTFERSPANRTATVLGLRPFREYRVKVRTIAKDAATGWQSDAVKFVTAQAAPSVPRSLNAVGKSLTSIEVRWKAPVELNGIVQQYEIKCRHSQQFGFANDFNMTIDAVAQPMRSIVIENLKMNTVYNVSVRERTGPGLWSIVVSTTTTTKEGALAPRNVLVSIISNSSVAVNWSSLAKEDVNGNLIGYLVVVSDNQGVVVFNRTVLSTQSQIKINMLQPSTYYNMKVSGLTKAGPGEQATVQFSTAKGEFIFP
eukprot:gene7798-8644_t